LQGEVLEKFRNFSEAIVSFSFSVWFFALILRFNFLVPEALAWGISTMIEEKSVSPIVTLA